MTVKTLVDSGFFTPVVLPEPERKVMGVYIGDLLSWVMGKATSGDAWITIMSNINILAVASLADTACIVIAEDVKLEENIIETAKQRNINIISSAADIYETAVFLNQVL